VKTAAKSVEVVRGLLTRVERRLLAGDSVPAIAAALGCGQTTVRNYVRMIRKAGSAAQVDLRPPQGPSKCVMDEIERRTIAGQSGVEIAAALGMPGSTVLYHMRKFGGSQIDTHLDHEQAADLERRILAGQPRREIQRETGRASMTVLRHARRLEAQLGAAMPPCRCGQKQGHAGSCVGVEGGNTAKPENMRNLIRRLVRAGGTRNGVARKLGVARRTVARYAAPAAGRMDEAAVLARVGRALPRAIGSSVRDEAMGEMMLAIMEGRLAPADIEARASSFINGSFRDWANKFGPRSLDEALGDDDERTGLDFLEDDTGIHMLDQITIGDEA
jgi:DNA-binding CsgD family transcriptional regulator